MGVATSKTVAGNYSFVSGFRPDGNASFDMGLFQEPNGDAWLVRSVHNRFAGFSKVNASCCTPYCSPSAALISVPPTRAGCEWACA